MEREPDFLILGPLEVRAGDQPVLLRTAKQRALVAVLLLHRGEVVSADRLIEALWGDEPPETASNTLQVYVSQVRKALASATGAGAGESLLATRSPGYLLRVEAEQLDSAHFERLVEEGTAALASGDALGASERLGRALALWRGPPLADFAYEEFARAEIARLEEVRLAATEEKIEADLALGRHALLVGELDALIARHPLRERLRAQLMLALYRSGRQAEALDVYQQTREALVEGLGIDPSSTLQELERAILNQDPSLDPPARAGAAQAPASPPAAGPPARSVRRPVTVLFLDVPLARRSGGEVDPEVLAEALPRIHQAVARVVEGHGGTVQRADAGEIRALFGVPRAHEDDSLRAVRAACEARDAIVSLGAELDAELGLAATIRAGISSGEVLVGSEAAGGAVGPALAVAARLRDAARSDEILLSKATRRLLREAVETEAVEPPVATPEGETLSAGRLVRVLPGAAAIARRSDAPLVGRAAELELLARSLESAISERRPQLVTVCGPAGIGKSRLARELIPIAAEDARVLQGRCLAYGEGTVFSPLAEIVRQISGDVSPLEGLRHALASEPERDLIADRLAAALGVSDSPGEPETTSWAFRKLLEGLSRERPLLVILDDLHWAESALLDLVEHFVDWATDAPILLLCLSRPELLADRPAWAGGRRQVSSLALEPLTPGDAAELVELLAGPGLDPVRRQTIVAASSGNPLFLEQLLAMTAEAGETGAASIPASVQALLAARLDQLEPEEAGLLEAAAVVGEEFWPSALAALEPGEGDAALRARLHLLIRKDLVEPFSSTLPGEDALRFRHALIREAAYERLPKAERADLHERFADWLEHRQSEIREYEETVGYHLEQAYRYRAELGPPDERDRALALRAGSVLASAGGRARKRGHSRASVGLLARALALLPDEHAGRGELLILLAEELLEVGDFHWSESVLDEIDSVAGGTDDELLSARALVLRLQHQLQVDPHVSTDSLARSVEAAIARFAERGDDRGQAKAWTVLAWLPWMRCQAEEAEEALRRGAEHARRAGDDRTEAEALSYLTGTALFGPLPVKEGIRRCEALLDHPSKLLQAGALRALAVLRAMDGDTLAARQLVAESKAVLDDLGLRYLAASAATEFGAVELLAGAPEAAETELRLGYETLSEMGEASGLSTIAAALAEALLAQGKLDEAVAFAETSEANAVADDLQTIVPARRVRAQALAVAGQVGAAESLAREAVELARQTDWLNLHADSLITLAQVLRLAGKNAETAAVVEQALRLYERKGNVASAAAARALLAETLATA